MQLLPKLPARCLGTSLLQQMLLACSSNFVQAFCDIEAFYTYEVRAAWLVVG